MKRSSLGLLLILGVVACVHLAVAWNDFIVLARNGFLYDDAFYAFQIARNIASGLGPTFDGVHMTNGFQPLYVLLLVPLFLISRGDPILPVHIALTMSALLAAATAWFFYRVASRYARSSAALIATALWAVSPVVMRQTANGLETALALFSLAWAVDYYLRNVRNNDTPEQGTYVRLGALLGLAILSRIDLVFFVLAMALDYLVVLRTRGAVREEIRGVAVGAAVAFAMCLPWLAYGAVAVGSAFPESGAATRYLSVAYAPFFDLGPATMESGPDARFVWGHLIHSFSVLKATPVVQPLFRSVAKLQEAGVLPAGSIAVTNVFSVLLVVALVGWMLRRTRAAAARSLSELNFLLLFSVLLIAAYSTWIFGVFFFIRYYYPIYFVLMLYAAVSIDGAFTWLAARSRVPRRALMSAAAVYAAAVLFMGFNAGFRTAPMYRFYDVACWVEQNTEPGETLGVFQSGTIGYLSKRNVVNLDGKVNREARSALREGRLNEYVTDAGISLIMDHYRVLDLFLGPWDKEVQQRVVAAQVFSGAECGLPGWIGYRVPLGPPQRASVDPVREAVPAPSP